MLRYIYTFFVGLFLAIFIGLGIAVFYEAPNAPEPPSWYASSEVKRELTDTQRREDQKYIDAQKSYEKQMLTYHRNVSIIVLVCAVLVLTIALTFARQLGVIADGLLLGGIFTLLYGIGIGMVTDSNKYRFTVAGIGLLITLILGYLKFTKHQMAIVENQAGRGAK